MTPTPESPKEQRSFADQGGAALGAPVPAARREPTTGVHSPEPGDADVSLDPQGRFGNLKQNRTTRSQVENR